MTSLNEERPNFDEERPNFSAGMQPDAGIFTFYTMLNYLAIFSLAAS
jgi:hypothetical protein